MALFETLSVGDAAIEGALTVGGAATVTGNASVGGTAAITGALTITGTTTSGVTVLLKDGAGKALLATGTTVPSDAGTVYAKGCLFIDTDVATGTTGLYCNKGTSASCVFTAVTQGA